MSQLSEILPKDYGYVVLAVAGGTLVNADHFRAVAKARKEFRIKSPQSYSEGDTKFNSVMRAHGNYLENYPFFATTMLIGGLKHPRLCAYAGLAWIISRLVYARVYVEDPAKRGRGFLPAMLSQMVMLGCTISFGLSQSGVVARCRSRFS